MARHRNECLALRTLPFHAGTKTRGIPACLTAHDQPIVLSRAGQLHPHPTAFAIRFFDGARCRDGIADVNRREEFETDVRRQHCRQPADVPTSNPGTMRRSTRCVMQNSSSGWCGFTSQEIPTNCATSVSPNVREKTAVSPTTKSSQRALGSLTKDFHHG